MDLAVIRINLPLDLVRDLLQERVNRRTACIVAEHCHARRGNGEHRQEDAFKRHVVDHLQIELDGFIFVGMTLNDGLNRAAHRL
eukprot:XP_001709396.1 Hypothetical protein GL50803_36980 [Giardia lamblia ATCC 50803]